MRKPRILILLYILLFILGVNGFPGGLFLMLAPDGSQLGMQHDWLYRTPFENYFFPGMILCLVNGVLPLFVLAGLIFHPKWKWPEKLNIYRDRYWAWTWSFYSGMILAGWIAIQELMTPSFWLQPVMILTALAIIAITMLPGVRNYYQK